MNIAVPETETKPEDVLEKKKAEKKASFEKRKVILDQMADEARQAAGLFLQYSQKEVDHIAREAVLAGIKYSQELAAMAVTETNMGIVEDKVLKNMVASEFTWDHIKNFKTVGVIAEHFKQNMVEVAEPHGVIFALTPVTNPTSTVIFKCIVALKTRNALVISPHSRAAGCSARAAQVMYEAAVKAGAPEGIIQCIDKAGREDTEYMFKHPQVALIDATGGTGMVKAAYSSGKPALGVGAGNTPVYIDDTADIEMAVVDILTSKYFDNGTVCASEQTLVIDEKVYDRVVDLMRTHGAYLCDDEQVRAIGKSAIHRGNMKPSMIGKPAFYIAGQAGFEIDKDTKVLLTPLKGIGEDHPLSGEKLFPVLGLYKARNRQDAINICLDLNYHGGTGHTASIFSNDDTAISEFSEQINAGRIIVNSPSSLGALGAVYNDLIPTFSFGCGTGGGNITMDNINVIHYLNIKKVARRTTTSMWFRAPSQIYFNQHSLENLRALESNSAVIVTSKVNTEIGHVDMLKQHIPQIPVIHVYEEVSPEPPISEIMRAVEKIREYRPDTIIALGGGSAIDAAKAIRFFYEHPEFDFRDLKVNFLDPRKRVVEFPKDYPRIRLIAIPTTSGTGSEVTPMAVITDDESETHSKVSMVDYTLVPDAAVIDCSLTLTVPPRVTVDTGMDALTHAIEAMVSTAASDFTDGLALQAIISVFKNLEAAYRDGKDIERRQRLHNAATIAGLAISNAFVGINHSLAHAVGAVFGVSHGRANAIFLPYTIQYNAQIPTKFTPSPNVKSYHADKKYAYIAQLAQLGGNSVDEQVTALVESVKDLQRRCDVENSFAEYGIDEKEYLEKLPAMVKIAMEDPSGRSNPRVPMMNEVRELLVEAYYGAKH